MAKHSKKRVSKSVANSVLEFVEGAWPHFERIIFEVVKALPQFSEPTKKRRAKRRAKRRTKK
jgi:hypothetical protein